jgi:hypothetical protein
MEINELVSFYINESSQTLEYTFRTIDDSEDEIRTGSIEFDEIKNFGYDFLDDITNSFKTLEEDGLFDDDDDYGEFGDLFEDEFDEQEFISFLNEYYLVNPKKLPKSELF